MNTTPTKSLEEHLHEFKTQGFTIFPRIIDEEWTQQMRDVHSKFLEENTGRHSFVDVIERAPDLAMQAAAIPGILDFAEMIIGPHIQLESITYTGFLPVSPEVPAHIVTGWHRDMFGSYPQEGVYHRPLLFNAIAYLAGLTDANGPLRVIPGSHMRAMGVEPEQAILPHPEEVLVYPEAGDLVIFHSSLLHSGTPNRSDTTRYFFCITYNHSWLKFRADYTGPNAQAIIRDARERGDNRIMRLFGVDDNFARRANSGFTLPDEEMWARWQGEDKAALKAEPATTG